MEEKPGPVFIELPENLAVQAAPPQILSVIPLPTSQPDHESIQAAASLIEKCLKPFVIVGDGVSRQDAFDELLQFADQLKAPSLIPLQQKGYCPNIIPSTFTHLDSRKTTSFYLALRRRIY